MDFIYEKIGSGSAAGIILAVAFMLFGGFLATRLTKRLRLPNVTGYILAGILLGPYCLRLVPASVAEGMDFLSDIALAFIAFGTGEFFRLETLRKNGAKVIVITVAESLAATLAVFCVCFFALRLTLSFSLVLGALAAATAPASTVMTIRQTGAHGDFVDTLLQTVALDDVVGLIAYSIAISLALAAQSGGAVDFAAVGKPMLINTAVLLLGALFGLLMKWLIPMKRSDDNKLIVSLSLLFAFCGICALADVSPLLGCMSMGTVYINVTGNDKLFKQLGYFNPPILLLFFVRSGVNFKLDALGGGAAAVGNVPLIAVGVLYFFVRILGKYGGAWLGCRLVGKAASVRRYLGLALIPQAGVAIGLAALGARSLGGTAGDALETVILASGVLYELVGPAAAKVALFLSGSYSDTLDALAPVPALTPEGKKRSRVEMLTEQIQTIRQDRTAFAATPSEEESAFDEAAEEQLARSRAPFLRGFGAGRR